IRCTSASAATSPVTATAWPPAFSTRATVPFAASASMSATTILAPSSAKSAAVSRPIPMPAPVISATLPASRPLTVRSRRRAARAAGRGGGPRRDPPAAPRHVRGSERTHVRHAEGVLPDVALPGVDDVAPPLHGVVEWVVRDPRQELERGEDARARALGYQ